MKSSFKIKTGSLQFLNRMLLLGVAVWTLLASVMLVWHLFDSRRDIEHIAHESASESIQKDVLYRTWAAEHDGVYVPVTEKTSPNPYLKNVKERDVTTLSGRKLTLINHDYMSRQVHELSKGKGGVLGHITSLRPIRPENRADSWETKALMAIEGGKKEHGEIVMMDGEPYYRHMAPLFIQKPCLKCHAAQGYKLGDLRGGISAAVPMKQYDAVSREHTISEIRHFAVVWLLGIAGMVLVRPYAQKRIQEREEVIARLEESEQRTRSIVDNAPFGAHLYRLEKNGRLIFSGANASADRILSVDNRQFFGLTIEEAFPLLADTHIPDTYRRIAATGKQVEFEQVDHNDHEIKGVFDVHAFQTAPNHVAVFFRDVTDRKKADDALRVSEARFRTIVDTSLEGILTIDDHGVITFTNIRMAEMLGYSRQELLGRSILDIVHEEERQDHQKQLELRRQGLATVYGRRFRRKDDTTIWTQASASPLYDERGIYCGAFGMFSDVTERMEVEKAFHESENRYRTLFARANDGIFILSSDGSLVEINDSFARMHGYRPEEMLQMNLRDLDTPEFAKLAPDRIRRILGGEALTFEVEQYHKDGHIIPLEVSASPISYGGKTFIQCFHRDITERKKAEEALRQGEEQFRLLLNSTGEAIYGIDGTGTCTFCNPACVRLLGYRDQEELLGRNMHEIMHHTRKDGAPYLLKECKVVGTIEDGTGVHVTDEVFWRADGMSFPVEYWSYPQIRDGKTVGAVVTFVDITDRIREEENLRQVQKMESVGTLAGGIAHDFNNIMMAIMGYAHLIRISPSQDPQSAMAADEIISASERAAQLTEGLLAFSRKQVMRRSVLDLNEVTRSFRNMIGRLLREDIELHLQLAHDSVIIDADRGQVEQVLMNLITNARDSMPKGGRIVITTEATEIRPAEIGRYHVPSPGTYGTITVSDTGQGMDQNTLSHIFEPFFTTKEVGKGTGLGLSMVYGIIKKHGGSIFASSEPGQGTTVTFYIPVTSAKPKAPSLRRETGHMTGSELVLVVEDDAAVRMVVRDILARYGYVILEAADGVQAAELFRQKGKKIRLVISDIVMPNKSGWELFQELKEVRPDVKFLFLSGYDRSMVLDQAAGSEKSVFLQKPLKANELLVRVREMLDSSG